MVEWNGIGEVYIESRQGILKLLLKCGFYQDQRIEVEMGIHQTKEAELPLTNMTFLFWGGAEPLFLHAFWELSKVLKPD